MSGKTFVKGQDKSRGLPPGTPVYIGQDREEPVHVTLIDFDETHVIEKEIDRKSTRLNSSHIPLSRMPSSA